MSAFRRIEVGIEVDIDKTELSAADIETLNGLNERYSSLGFLPYE